MNRSLLWIWLLVGAALLLLPGPAGRLLLDLLGGVTLLLLLTPLILAGLGLLAWRLLASRLRSCPRCGLTSLRSDVAICPACGWCDGVSSTPDQPAATVWAGSLELPEIAARDVTITVTATGVGEEQDSSG